MQLSFGVFLSCHGSG
uniref:Uncharacterized protein n=1 Tax=Arundo donax TaxID=35708 RepID=A0A0A9DZ78_ARUDO